MTKIYKVCPMCGSDEIFRETSGIIILDVLERPFLTIEEGFKPDYADYEEKEPSEYDDMSDSITEEFSCESCRHEYKSDNLHDVVRHEMITREEWKAKGVIV